MKTNFKLHQWLSPSIYIVTTVLGLLALIYPFLLPAVISSAAGEARAAEMPLLMTVMLGLSLLVLIYEVQGGAFNTKLVALLGMLVAINAALRFVEVGIPGPGGFSPIFFLIILTGYLFGSRFGFLMGTLTIFVSSIITGGIGPWLPSQMLAAGWVGMSAALLAPIVSRAQPINRHLPSRWGGSMEILILAVFGFVWGLLYGLIMNLWSWPYFSGPADQYWLHGISVYETIQRYTSYYLLTSLVWDLGRGVGTAVLLVAFGLPALRALRRFQRRFTFFSEPVEEVRTSDKAEAAQDASIQVQGRI